MGETVVKADKVGIEFNLTQEHVDNLKEYLIRFMKGNLRYKSFWALKDVSFEIKRGDKVGIVGLNGAGKSTLLKIIAGVMKPTEGEVKTKGKIVPLLELGAGFDSEYSGRENIFLYGALLGFSKKYLQEKFDDIVEFSEIEDFIDVPLKNYSSGMKARLAFSIATMVDAEILIIDEVLSVGDARFRVKSQNRMKSLLKEDVTVLFVSHVTEQVRYVCNNAIWIQEGKLMKMGPVDEICDLYEKSNEENIKS